MTQACYQAPYPFDGKIFVSPAIEDFVICVGASLFSWPQNSSHPLGPKIVNLSRVLETEVQFFATHRVSGSHEWAKAVRAKLIRHYGVSDGEVTADEGAPTPEEIRVGIDFEGGPLGGEDSEGIDEEAVMKVSAAWGVDTWSLGERALKVPPGILGRLPAIEDADADRQAD
jgi:hypothetical protein